MNTESQVIFYDIAQYVIDIYKRVVSKVLQKLSMFSNPIKVVGKIYILSLHVEKSYSQF